MRLLSHPSQPQGFEVLDRAPEVIDSLIGEGVDLDKPALLDLLLAEMPVKRAAALAAEITGVRKNLLYQAALERQGKA